MNKVNHLAGSDFADSTVVFSLYKTHINYRYYEGAYLSVFQQTITDSAYVYWQQADQLISRSGGAFEEPPGRIRGNFYRQNHTEEVFGYFYVTAQDTFRVYIPPEVTSSSYLSYCDFASDKGIPFFLCPDCLNATNSSLVKPDWWIH